MANKSLRGRFLWHELMTPNPNAAERFYTKVVGWKTQAWDQNPSYKMWMAGAKSMGGLMVTPAGGPPPQWFCYIGTPDVDATVRQAVELGGTVMKPAMDLPNVGRFAFLQDPQGAPFAVFKPSTEPQEATDPGVGDFSWHELPTTNWQAAWDFYSRLFGWTKTSAMDMGPDGTYQMFGLEGRVLGGMYNNRKLQGKPYWLPYARVRDAKATVDSIKQLGGTIASGPMQVPGGDWIVTGRDPEGVWFAVHSKAAAAAAPSGASRKTAPRRKPAGARKAAKKRPARRSKTARAAKKSKGRSAKRTKRAPKRR
jgi:uncharacterized protein